MLRASLPRIRTAARPLGPARPPWLASYRFFADEKTPDPTSSRPTPTPSTVQSTLSTTASASSPSAEPAAATPPTGTGTAPPPPPLPKSKKRRGRRVLVWLTGLTAVGYAAGVYFSLVSDNFYDTFTEYVPFGDDAVGYFEDRAFRRRFPGRAGESRFPPPHQVTIPSKHGLTSRVTGDADGAKDRGPHVSAVAGAAKTKAKQKGAKDKGEGPSVPHEVMPQMAQLETKGGPPPEAKTKSKSEAKPEAKSEAKPQPKPKADPPPKAEAQETAAATLVPPIDHLEVPSANEPVVQDVVKILNDIITVVNTDGAGATYSSTLEKSKGELAKVVADINMLKQKEEKAAQGTVETAHREFDTAARELVRRLELQMHDQEARWREEFETERERLAQTYREKVTAELETAEKVHEQRTRNELLEQSVALQRRFGASVRQVVEHERSGRLGRLGELEKEVAELEQLTADWNDVIEANLQTQRLVVALNTVRSVLSPTAEDPSVPPPPTTRPFISELAALKEVGTSDAVVTAAIASIPPPAYQLGIPSAAALIDRFRRVAAEVRKAALVPEDAGVASHAASLALSKFMFRKDGRRAAVADDASTSQPPGAADVEAVLARTEALLEEGDLDAAAREVNSLSGWAKVLSQDWLAEARRVLEVCQALDVVAAEARLMCLLVE